MFMQIIKHIHSNRVLGEYIGLRWKATDREIKGSEGGETCLITASPSRLLVTYGKKIARLKDANEGMIF